MLEQSMRNRAVNPQQRPTPPVAPCKRSAHTNANANAVHTHIVAANARRAIPWGKTAS